MSANRYKNVTQKHLLVETCTGTHERKWRYKESFHPAVARRNDSGYTHIRIAGFQLNFPRHTFLHEVTMEHCIYTQFIKTTEAISLLPHGYNNKYHAPIPTEQHHDQCILNIWNNLTAAISFLILLYIRLAFKGGIEMSFKGILEFGIQMTYKAIYWFKPEYLTISYVILNPKSKNDGTVLNICRIYILCLTFHK